MNLTEAQEHALARTDTAIANALRSLQEARQMAAGTMSTEPTTRTSPQVLQQLTNVIHECITRVGNKSFSPSLCQDRLLSTADKLVGMGEYEAAKSLCYDEVLSLIHI